ncbi:MAG: hypothetical protein LBJ25_05170, partial [Candidatus Margulisbacteria bacterium]|nr:hypothetical protein [Candidatus Margulisiibacteriota bacterium]
DIGIWLGTKIADAILDALEQDQQKQLTLAEHINRVFFDLPYSGSRDDLGTRQGITCGMALDENNAHRRKDRQDLVSSG